MLLPHENRVAGVLVRPSHRAKLFEAWYGPPKLIAGAGPQHFLYNVQYLAGESPRFLEARKRPFAFTVQTGERSVQTGASFPPSKSFSPSESSVLTTCELSFAGDTDGEILIDSSGFAGGCCAHGDLTMETCSEQRLAGMSAQQNLKGLGAGFVPLEWILRENHMIRY